MFKTINDFDVLGDVLCVSNLNEFLRSHPLRHVDRETSSVLKQAVKHNMFIEPWEFAFLC